MHRENYIKVEIFYKELSYESIRQQKAFEFLSLVSEIGGFMGLLLGASILTMCELLDYLALSSIRRCRRANAASTAYLDYSQKVDLASPVSDKPMDSAKQ